ncbi:hypothetical protein [Myroides sp. N17-2]|uniref:hypothetical protein n=1 Tax=Myroides sp. N17-2 TaxID=2030799 RepID=UPI000EFC8347|nr:hypothetical protein [Myroides sp. N17-2]
MKKIRRLAFWFTRSGEDYTKTISEHFFSIQNLYTRLLNEVYDGSKIGFFNLCYVDPVFFDTHPEYPRNGAFGGGEHLQYYGEFDIDAFFELTENEKKRLLWEKVYLWINEVAKQKKNPKLAEANHYAYHKGIQLNLNADFKRVEKEIIFKDKVCEAAVWINFFEDYMSAKFSISDKGKEVYAYEFQKAENGIEFFLDMFKKIEQKGNNVIVKGHYDVDYLPKKFDLEELGMYK